VGFENVLNENFQGALPEKVFVEKTLGVLAGKGFTPENAIACVGVCRDEITQPFVEFVKEAWGEAFNFSSLAGMLFLGKTGFSAAQHHAPDEDGRERYVYFALPHIAIHEDGQIGVCRRIGRKEPSSACGALLAFQKEMESGSLNLGLDFDDVEQSLIRMRLLQEIPYGQVPDLPVLTKTTLKVIQKDLTRMIQLTVNTDRSDYAVLTGIQIHGPDRNYIWPDLCYSFVNGVQREITI
jgi:hypothetical protein